MFQMCALLQGRFLMLNFYNCRLKWVNSIFYIFQVPAKFKELEYASGPTTIFILRLVKYVLYFILGAYVMGLIYYMQACYFE